MFNSFADDEKAIVADDLYKFYSDDLPFPQAFHQEIQWRGGYFLAGGALAYFGAPPPEAHFNARI